MSGKHSQTSEKLIEAKIPGEETGIEIKKTLCAVCGFQCAIDAYVKDGRLIKVEGTEDNPVNKGTLCSKGAANRQWIYSPERLQTPLMRTGERGDGAYAPISWEEALDRIASRLLKIKAETGPESVVFFAGYPKVMRPFLKRLAHTFGSPNYCTESSVCYLGANLAGIMNYGYELGPVGGAEVKNTQCILNWSTNPFYSSAPSGVHFLNALERGAKLIEVGPLKTPLSERADIHLRLRPGTSGALALGMAHVIIEEGLYDREFVENWTLGFDEYRAYAQEFTPETVERITGVPKEKIIAAARLYATTKPAAIATSSNTTVHHTNGVQNHRALTALIGLTGNFDRPGGNHPVPTSYYARATGLKHREHEFEQTRPWEEMAPRIGQEQHPVWCKVYLPGAGHGPARFRSKAQALSHPSRSGFRSQPPHVARIGFHEGKPEEARFLRQCGPFPDRIGKTGRYRPAGLQLLRTERAVHQPLALRLLDGTGHPACGPVAAGCGYCRGSGQAAHPGRRADRPGTRGLHGLDLCPCGGHDRRTQKASRAACS